MKAKEVAVQLFKQGFELEAIQKVTGLNAQQLEKLREPAVGAAAE